MSDEIQISQAASLASGNTQIGVQNNYNGLSLESASRILLELFTDNFPKLQKLAYETAKKRAEELWGETIQRLSKTGFHDLTPFSDPDVQYVFWEAQRDYARLGKHEMLETLSSLLAERIAYNGEEYIKIVIDRALSAAKYINKQQLDYLSLLFFCKHATFCNVLTIDDLIKQLNEIKKIYNPCGFSGFSLLKSLGCLELNIGFITTILAKRHDLPEEIVKANCPPEITALDTDYGLSHVGIVLAITNMHNNPANTFKCRLEDWIYI